MSNVNFKNSKGIIEELENAVNDVSMDNESIKLAQTRITGCKHAIQVFALSLEHARMLEIKSPRLKAVELE